VLANARSRTTYGNIFWSALQRRRIAQRPVPEILAKKKRAALAALDERVLPTYARAAILWIVELETSYV